MGIENKNRYFHQGHATISVGELAFPKDEEVSKNVTLSHSRMIQPYELGFSNMQRYDMNIENNYPYLNQGFDNEIKKPSVRSDESLNYGETNSLIHMMNPYLQTPDPLEGYGNTSMFAVDQQWSQMLPGCAEKNIYPSPPVANFENQFSDVYVSDPSAIYQNTVEFPDSVYLPDNLITEDQNQPNIPYTNTSNYHSKSNILENAYQKFMEFVPVFAKINGNNFKELLVGVLRECLHQFSVEDLYNLLYISEISDNMLSSHIEDLKINQSESANSRLEGFQLCHLILKTFRQPGADEKLHLTPNLLHISVNFHDVCKNFLAIKIMFDCVILVDDSSISDCYLPRSSMYKAYFIICKKLIQKYPNNSSNLSNGLLNQSQLGKIIKLNFPQLKATRFGKRGESTFHYRGVVWNNAVIYEDTKRLIGLTLPDIASYFEHLQVKRLQKINQPETEPSNTGLGMLTPVSESNLQILRPHLFKKKPIHSFVHFLNTLPVADCFPRSWKKVPGEIPQQSEWAKETMRKSVTVLKCHNIDVEPLLCEIDITVFCAESLDNFFEGVLLIIRFMMEVSASDQLYLHLYLVLSTLIFPIAFSSNKEVSNRDKVQLRRSLKNFVTRLESGFLDLPLFNNLMAFANVMKKMIIFNDLLLSQYRTTSTKSITSAMVGDAQLDLSTDQESLKDLVIREALKACSAFNWEFLDEPLRKNSKHQIMIVQSIANMYFKLSITGSEVVVHISESMTEQELDCSTYEVLYYIFEAMQKIFHEVFLSESLMLQLPIKLIDSFMSSITSEFQNLSFRQFSNREPELSKEIFKAWWVHLNLVHEYFDILSEITAISALAVNGEEGTQTLL